GFRVRDVVRPVCPGRDAARCRGSTECAGGEDACRPGAFQALRQPGRRAVKQFARAVGALSALRIRALAKAYCRTKASSGVSARGQRTTSTGILLCSRTLAVSLPSKRLDRPRRPCEAIRITSHFSLRAIAMIC